MDIALALLPSLLFGIMSIMVMLLGGDNRQQTLGELTGGFVVALVTLPLIGGELAWSMRLVAFCSGLILGIGFHYQIKCFHILGVSRTMPLSTGGQLLGISLLGIVLFGEWQNNGALPVGLVGLGLVIVGGTFTTWTQKAPPLLADQAAIEGVGGALGPTVVPPEDTAGSRTVSIKQSSGVEINWSLGIITLIISTIALVAYVILLRVYGIDPLVAFFPQACGFLIAGLVFTSPRFTPELGSVDTRWSKFTLRQIMTGIVWGIGLLVMQYSTVNVGVATGFTLSQLGVIISTVGGILILKESRTKKELIFVSSGIVLLVLGAVLIGVAKGLDSGG